MKMTFYTPSYGVLEHKFSAATFGFVGKENEYEKNAITFPVDLEGDMVCGSYEECLAQIAKLKNQSWKVGIVLLGNAGGENIFVHMLAKQTGVPLVGGGAAINPETGESALITGRGQATVFLIRDERYEFEVCCENIHYDIISEHDVSYTDSRRIEAIDGHEPVEWFRREKEKLGLSVDDFEHLTLTDEHGINAHLSYQDGQICSGRDLQPHMYLRYVPSKEVFARMQHFYEDSAAIVFGCAGLKGILPKHLQTEGVGLFLFGEVCTKDGHSEFGNLMLSKLRVLKR